MVVGIFILVNDDKPLKLRFTSVFPVYVTVVNEFGYLTVPLVFAYDQAAV